MAPKKEREILQRYEWVDGVEIERTKQKRIEDRGFSRTQKWLALNTGLGIALMVWDRLDYGFEQPLIFGVPLGAVVILLPLVGLIGKETIAALMDGLAKFKGKP